MTRKPEIERKVEDALNSLEGIQRAEAQPWFFARVKARIERGRNQTTWEKAGTFLARPAVALAALCLVLTLNLSLLLAKRADNATGIMVAQGDQTTVMDSESIIASNSSFDYENLLQP